MNNIFPFHTIPELWQNRSVRHLLHIMIIAGVFLVSIALAILSSNQITLLLLVGIIIIIGVIILIQFPSLGLLIILIGGFSIPYSGPGGFNAAILGVAATAALWLFDMIVRQRSLYLVPSRTNLPIIVFIVSSVISLGIGQVPWYPTMHPAPITAQLGGFAIFALSAVAFLLVANLVKKTIWLKLLVWFFVLMGVIYIFGRMNPWAVNYIRPLFQAGATTGSLFWVWLTVIPFSQALLNNRLNKIVRAGLFVFVIAVLYVAIVLTNDWKSGYIPPLAGIGIITFLWLRKRAWILLPVIPVFIFIVSQQAIETDQYSWFSRLEAWKIVFQLSIADPIFGLGFSNYYWYTPLIPISGWYVNFNSHSQFIDIFAQTGLFGLLCFVWVFGVIGKLGLALRDKVDDGFDKAYVYGAIGGLAGTIVAGFFVDWILPFVYNIGMTGFRSSMLSWLFLGGLVSLENIVRNKSSS